MGGYFISVFWIRKVFQKYELLHVFENPGSRGEIFLVLLRTKNFGGRGIPPEALWFSLAPLWSQRKQL